MSVATLSRIHGFLAGRSQTDTTDFSLDRVKKVAKKVFTLAFVTAYYLVPQAEFRVARIVLDCLLVLSGDLISDSIRKLSWEGWAGSSLILAARKVQAYTHAQKPALRSQLAFDAFALALGSLLCIALSSVKRQRMASSILWGNDAAQSRLFLTARELCEGSLRLQRTEGHLDDTTERRAQIVRGAFFVKLQSPTASVGILGDPRFRSYHALWNRWKQQVSLWSVQEKALFEESLTRGDGPSSSWATLPHREEMEALYALFEQWTPAIIQQYESYGDWEAIIAGNTQPFSEKVWTRYKDSVFALTLNGDVINSALRVCLQTRALKQSVLEEIQSLSRFRVEDLTEERYKELLIVTRQVVWDALHASQSVLKREIDTLSTSERSFLLQCLQEQNSRGGTLLSDTSRQEEVHRLFVAIDLIARPLVFRTFGHRNSPERLKWKSMIDRALSEMA